MDTGSCQKSLFIEGKRNINSRRRTNKNLVNTIMASCHGNQWKLPTTMNIIGYLVLAESIKHMSFQQIHFRIGRSDMYLFDHERTTCFFLPHHNCRWPDSVDLILCTSSDGAFLIHLILRSFQRQAMISDTGSNTHQQYFSQWWINHQHNRKFRRLR